MLCPNCESGELIELETEDGGWMCENATEDARLEGTGCGALISITEMKKMKQAVAQNKSSTTTHKKTPTHAHKHSGDEDEDEAAGDQDGDDDDSDGEADEDDHGSQDKENAEQNHLATKKPAVKPVTSCKSKSSLSHRRAPVSSLPINNNASASKPVLSAHSSASFRAKVKKLAAQKLAAYDFDLDDHVDISAMNTAQLIAGSLHVQRAPIMSSLSVKGHENCNADMYRRAFIKPRISGTATKDAQQLMQREKFGRRLGMRLHFGGVLPPMIPHIMVPPPMPLPTDTAPAALPIKDLSAESAVIRKKEGFEPLIIWTQSQLTAEERAKYADRCWAEQIEVPPVIARFLRPHQREGVRFLAECVLGLRKFDGNGAILADDMGLGKTLQSIALLYTLLTQGFDAKQTVARRVVIITPTSLVTNWKNEIQKWLQDRITSIAISESNKQDVIDRIHSFLHPTSPAAVLIISYDTFRLHCALFMKCSSTCCDLLICDEAHRLKNSKTSTYMTLDSVPVSRRILLSGTPLQNNLDEFYAMINFTNHNVLGDRRMFRKYYEMPILIGREPLADEEEQQLGMQRSSELSAIVNQFVLRRTNMLLSKHLPPKVMQVVCCRPTLLQMRLYDHLLKHKEVKKLVKNVDAGTTNMRTDILPLIGALKKLCNHPKLIYDALRGRGAGAKRNNNSTHNKRGSKAATASALDEDDVMRVIMDDDVEVHSDKLLSTMFKGSDKLFAEVGFDRAPISAQWSGKMWVLERLLTTVRKQTDDRVIIVSNFTSALDVIADLCGTQRWAFLRLDGSTTIKNRQKLVDQLSDRNNNIFCFLLSSRAGGCGLNLIGANRLILFDPDWNPAVDKQAAARVWRDGQHKRCFIYRLLTTGTIEEKIYQRQLSKQGLAEVLGGGMNEAACTQDELRELFTIRSADSSSDTHDHLNCDCLDTIMITQEEEEQKKKEALQLLEQQQQQHQQTEEQAECQEDMIVVDQNDGESNGVMDMTTDTTVIDVTEDGSDSADAVVSSDDANSDDDNFIVNDDDNEFASSSDDDTLSSRAKASSKKQKKEEKKEKKKKRRSLKTSLVVDPLQLHSINSAMIGQRGCPPEEELINWAHHITAQSAPDPLFRKALGDMQRTKDGYSYVSFIFSCEVAGKQIGSVIEDEEGREYETAETREFAAYSAKCDLSPVLKQTGPSVTITADDAWAKHKEMIAMHEKKKRKRMGLRSDDDDDEAAARLNTRRQSSRLTHKQSLNEDALMQQSLMNQDEPVLEDADPETQATIRALLAEDKGERRGRKKKRDVEQAEEPAEEEQQEEEGEAAGEEEQEEEQQQEQEEDEQDNEESLDVPSSLPVPQLASHNHTNKKHKAESPPPKNKKTTHGQTNHADVHENNEDDDDDDDNSSVEVTHVQRSSKHKNITDKPIKHKKQIKTNNQNNNKSTHKSSSKHPVVHDADADDDEVIRFDDKEEEEEEEAEDSNADSSQEQEEEDEEDEDEEDDEDDQVIEVKQHAQKAVGKAQTSSSSSSLSSSRGKLSSTSKSNKLQRQDDDDFI